MGTLVLLDLMGGVALLLWGLHMVQSGIMRAFGPDLRRILSRALCNRVAAFGAGLGLTALLQSSTAMTPKVFHAPIRSDRGSGQDAIPDTSAHAAATFDSSQTTKL
jgi:hypothetical protein